MFPWPKKSFQFEEALQVAPWKIRHVQFFQYDADKLKQSLNHFRHVTHLELGWGQSTVIPVEIASLSKLQHLTILNVALNGFPEAVLECRSLQELCIRGADIPFLPDSLEQLANLKTLHIGNCGLVELPSCLSRMHHLKVLEFPDNPAHPDSVFAEFTSNLAPVVFDRESLHQDDSFRSQGPVSSGHCILDSR